MWALISFNYSILLLLLLPLTNRNSDKTVIYIYKATARNQIRTLENFNQHSRNSQLTQSEMKTISEILIAVPIM